MKSCFARSIGRGHTKLRGCFGSMRSLTRLGLSDALGVRTRELPQGRSPERSVPDHVESATANCAGAHKVASVRHWGCPVIQDRQTKTQRPGRGVNPRPTPAICLESHISKLTAANGTIRLGYAEITNVDDRVEGVRLIANAREKLLVRGSPQVGDATRGRVLKQPIRF